MHLFKSNSKHNEKNKERKKMNVAFSFAKFLNLSVCIWMKFCFVLFFFCFFKTDGS